MDVMDVRNDTNDPLEMSRHRHADAIDNASEEKLDIQRYAAVFLREAIRGSRIQPFSPHTTKEDTPYTILTYAQSLDGYIALPGNKPLIISGKESMIMTHSIRALVDGILVGVGTVIADNPMLNVRLADKDVVRAVVLDTNATNDSQEPKKSATTSSTQQTKDTPRPIILDSNLRTPINSRILSRNPILVCANTLTSDNDSTSRIESLKAAGAEIFSVPTTEGGRLDVRVTLRLLKSLFGIRTLMVEGGSTVISSFLSADLNELVDKVIVTVAPVWMGNGVKVVQTLDSTRNEARLGMAEMEEVQVAQFGRDVVIAGPLKR
ncbi:2,5-diamino-6-(ribosylamino)-4(3H)-pyrimidinone 5'-phosphate reductase [Chytridiales sp. JEL 0842]|nr:2,5-diamino-6-(ribosylamino)-4(3H)-pyrimidinone 5'-phosphate reductase [Chytridiales sp. JEL 0842]